MQNVGGETSMPMTTKKERKVRRARLLRRAKIQRVAEDAARRWRDRKRGRPAPAPIPALPRPQSLGVAGGREFALPPPPRQETFEAGLWASFGRLGLWLSAAARFLFAVLWDKVKHRDSVTRRAVRLRTTFQSMGITFIKLGQQLSMRLDLLPYEYTRELENMLSDVNPIPGDQAEATIERLAGKPLDQIFAAFDHHPVGSASIACVYRAVLTTGEEVAVKVRRPNIGNDLAVDMRALGWLMKAAELVFLRPGFTKNFLSELRMMLLEELDLVREARFGEIFRRRMRKTKQFHFASAPRVFFEHSSAEVMVTEFVSGIWVSEILTAIETNDSQALAKLESMNIDPIVVARRIQLIARFNNFEHIFFHADLHPKNILIQPGNKVILIDFGSCGSFDRKELNSWRRWFDAQSVDDVAGMVQAAMALIEPMPPIDKAEFSQRLQYIFWNDLYAIKSKHSHWSERISARLWMGFLKLSREYEIPMRLNTLRMIRASMLADTIAARLDNDQDPYEEYRHYEKGASKRARKRLIKRLRVLLGPRKTPRIEQGIESGLKLFYRVQRALDSLDFIGIIPLIGKAAEAVKLIFVTLFSIGGTAVVWTLLIMAYRFLWNRRLCSCPDLRFFCLLWNEVLQNRAFEVVAWIPILIAVRRIFVRLKDRDYDRPR
jgi:predicted unusual protein kinase regulating ubiquinone biosynthesis (AarF/ABC1/UbiB family)